MSVSVKVSGDFAKLDAFIKKLGTAGSKMAEAVAKAMGAAALAQVQLGFREERDPDGVKWAPLQSHTGKSDGAGRLRTAKGRFAARRQILSRTGRLRRSFSMKAVPGGFRIATNVAYAKHHQFGAPRANIPTRRMLPKSGTIGKAWKTPLQNAARNAIMKFWGRR